MSVGDQLTDSAGVQSGIRATGLQLGIGSKRDNLKLWEQCISSATILFPLKMIKQSDYGVNGSKPSCYLSLEVG